MDSKNNSVHDSQQKLIHFTENLERRILSIFDYNAVHFSFNFNN